MCRLLFVSGSEKNASNELIDALVESARKDPTNGDESHKDGFGCVLLGKKDGLVDLKYFRSIDPIFESEKEINQLKADLNEYENFALLLHARKISSGEKNVINTHPYVYSLQMDSHYFFAHNGTLNTSAVKDAFKIETDAHLSDSLLFGLGVSKNVKNEDDFKKLVKSGKSFVEDESAFNTINLLYGRNKMNALLTSYHVGHKYDLYYQMFILRNSHMFAFMSSTLAFYLDGKLKDNLEEVSNGTLIEIDDVLGLPKITFEPM